jgi:hypothetical protein
MTAPSAAVGNRSSRRKPSLAQSPHSSRPSFLADTLALMAPANAKIGLAIPALQQIVLRLAGHKLPISVEPRGQVIDVGI